MPITTCDSSEILRTEIETVRKKVSLDETEETWDTIAQGIQYLTRLCNIGGCEFPLEMVAGIRSVSRPLNSALNSDRSRLSGAAVELVTVLATGLGSVFDPLVPQFVPTLLALCGRTNKVFTSRARASILAIIQHTRLPSVLPHLAELANHKSVFSRLTAAEGILACLNCCNPPDLEKETRARIVEDFIKLTARDASADVRKASKEVFKAYKTLMPARVDSFVAPLTPVVKKYLDVHPGCSGVHGTSSNAVQRQISRPPSRTNNKAMELVQRPSSSTLPEPPSRLNPNNTAHNTRQRLPVQGPPPAASVRAPRQRTMSQMQREPPPPRNLHVTAQSSGAAQRCVVSTNPPSRLAVQRPPPGAARILPVPNAHSTRGPQRPPPVLMKLNPPIDRLKAAGNGAKRIPLPSMSANGHASEPAAAATDSGGRTGSTVDRPSAKPPNWGAEAIVPGKLAVGRKAPESGQSSSTSTKPGRRPALPGPTAAQRPRQRAVKGGMTNPSGIAPQRRLVGNVQKSTRPLVKAESKAISPTLIPLPPSPSASPTEIPLPPSPDCTSHPADLEAPNEAVLATLSGPTELAGEQIKIVEQESADVGNPSTPITALLSSIQRGFLFTPSTPLSPPQNYLPTCGDVLEKKQNPIIMSGAGKGPSACAPFCISLDDSALEGPDRHAFRDLN